MHTIAAREREREEKSFSQHHFILLLLLLLLSRHTKRFSFFLYASVGGREWIYLCTRAHSIEIKEGHREKDLK